MAQASADTIMLEDLVRRWRAGDAVAREELIRRSAARLERLTRKLLRGFPGVRRWEETDDVFQNAMTRLWNSLHVVTPDSLPHFFSLAALQIRRELLDLKKHYFGPHGLGANHDTQDGEADAGARVADAAEGRSRADGPLESVQFHELVDGLPDREREVVDLLIYHGYTQIEAAALLQVSVRTVQNRYMASLVRLRQALRAEDGL